MPNYPELENLMSGWLHQDFDINGDTLEAGFHEIVQRHDLVPPSEVNVST
jgi:hypothetical protein